MQARTLRLATVLVVTAATGATAVAAEWGRGERHQDGWHPGGRGHARGGQGAVVVDPYPGDPYPVPPYPEPYPAPQPGPYPGPYPSPYPPGDHPDAAAAAPPLLSPVWFYCTDPGGFYPYVTGCHRDWQPLPVTPPPPGSTPPPNFRSLAYCNSPQGYYPYIATCAEQWQERPPGPPPDVEAVNNAFWFYCTSARDYYPYAARCEMPWQSVPAVPPPRSQPVHGPAQVSEAVR
jgi:hypothetical protein